ncbi:MAG TPA: nucleoside-diphosphate sugar epimerase/dehydratase [Synergistales bacterium]|nr:nucleoside-diphosphate sugar epimerase/dehydratase [Synergistales bacterium]
MRNFSNTLVSKLILDLLFGGVFASLLSFVLRLDTLFGAYLPSALTYAVISTFVLFVVEIFFRLPRRSWRSSSMNDLIHLFKAVFVYGAITGSLLFLFGGEYRVPRSIALIDPALTFMVMGAMRFGARALSETNSTRGHAFTPKRVLIVGAGEAGVMIAREMRRHPESGLLPVGFLDDDPSKKRAVFAGVPVRGQIDDIPAVVEKLGIEEVLISIPSASGALVRRIVGLSRKARVPHRIIPGIYEVLSGAVNISHIRDVDVADLLGREQVTLDMDAITRYLSGKRIMVTGAGGSIGSEIVRQLTRFFPEMIILVGRGENSLFELQMELKEISPQTAYHLVVADVQNRPKMARLMKRYSPQVVFHTAAHKHVPLMEANPDQAIINNVGGTRNVAELALEGGVEHFVNISTDKAVNPTSIMGASKRIAEMIVRQCASRAGEGQSFVSVRFGNVLGSRGSVIPVFKEQIRRGGPVTITHPDMKRYFMTIPEAAQLVLQAASMTSNGTVFVLDMGKPVLIRELAEDLIQLSGYQPYEDIDIVYTGLRPGEKLFEEILTAEEGTTGTHHDKIYIANQDEIGHDFSQKLEHLLEAAAKNDQDEIFRTIKQMVPAFMSERLMSETGKNHEREAAS